MRVLRSRAEALSGGQSGRLVIVDDASARRFVGICQRSRVALRHRRHPTRDGAFYPLADQEGLDSQQSELLLSLGHAHQAVVGGSWRSCVRAAVGPRRADVTVMTADITQSDGQADLHKPLRSATALGADRMSKRWAGSAAPPPGAQSEHFLLIRSVKTVSFAYSVGSLVNHSDSPVVPVRSGPYMSTRRHEVHRLLEPDVLKK